MLIHFSLFVLNNFLLKWKVWTFQPSFLKSFYTLFLTDNFKGYFSHRVGFSMFWNYGSRALFEWEKYLFCLISLSYFLLTPFQGASICPSGPHPGTRSWRSTQDARGMAGSLVIPASKVFSLLLPSLGSMKATLHRPTAVFFSFVSPAVDPHQPLASSCEHRSLPFRGALFSPTGAELLACCQGPASRLRIHKPVTSAPRILLGFYSIWFMEICKSPVVLFENHFHILNVTAGYVFGARGFLET